MNNEDKTPSYGDLYADNFRLEHNNRVLQQRIDKAIKFLDKVREENGNEIGQVNYETLLEILRGKDE